MTDKERWDFVESSAAELAWIEHGRDRLWLVMDRDLNRIGQGSSARIAVDNAKRKSVVKPKRVGLHKAAKVAVA